LICFFLRFSFRFSLPPSLHLILPSLPLLLLPTRSPSSPSPLLLTNFPNADSLFLSLVDLSPSLVPDQAPVGAHAALAHAVKPAAPRAGRERGCGDGGVE
jgi:hypothetical protein